MSKKSKCGCNRKKRNWKVRDLQCTINSFTAMFYKNEERAKKRGHEREKGKKKKGMGHITFRTLRN